MKRCFLLGFAFLIALAMNSPAVACAACFGKSDSPMAYGMNAGILTLLAVIVPVLGLIASFFAYIIHRAHRLSQTSESKLPTT